MDAPQPDPVEALLHPRNIVIVGASDRPRHWSGRTFANLKRFGYPGGIYPVNPRREEIWGERCYPDLASLPEAPDHVLCFVPAEVAIDVLREAAGAGARSALVFAGSFGEGGEAEGRKRAEELRAVVEEAGLALCGPNCMGNVAAPSRAVTMPDDGLAALDPSGPTAVIAQSGGLCIALSRILAERGLNASYIVSAGNQLGLGAGDYIRFVARQDHIRAVVLYLEQVIRAEEFVAAARAATEAGKALVAVKIGGSDAGRAAALAHTGALAGSVEAFDAVAGAAGIVRVDCLEEAVEAVEYLARMPVPAGPGVAVMTNSGAMKSLVSESAARNGIRFPKLQEATCARLAEALGPLATPANPLDTRQTIRTESYLACVEAITSDPAVDILLLGEDLPLIPGIERKEKNLAGIGAWTRDGPPKPVALFAPISIERSEHAKSLRASVAHLPYLSDPDRTFKVLGRILAASARRKAASGNPSAAPKDGLAVLRALEAEAKAGARSLGEDASKAFLRAWGIPLPRERVAADADEAAAVAAEIGFPVVVKAVSSGLPHKTEAGAIALGLGGADAVRAACADIAKRVAAYDRAIEIEGYLVAEQVRGGAEMALGIARDPEMGPVVMFGSGGIELELYKDVAFGRPDLTRAEAEAMIDATRAGARMWGFRGAPALDRGAAVEAILALGRLAAEAVETVEAVDINPFLVRTEGKGAVALDALVVLAERPLD